MLDTKDFVAIKHAVEAMTREEFLNKIVLTVGRRKDFAEIVTFGTEYTDENHKNSLRHALEIAGIGKDFTDTDEKLDYAIAAITARSVQLR